MADTAVRLEEQVLPEVPVRHWICSLPWGLRALLGYDSKLCARVLQAFITELSRSLKHRAKKHLGLASMALAHTGAVAAVQRVDSALRLNVHFHVLSLDGVYVRCDQSNYYHSPLRFHSLPTPTRAETAEIARRTAERIEQILQAEGRSLDPELADAGPTELELDQPGLAACYDAAARGIETSGERAGQPSLRLFTGGAEQVSPTDMPDEPVAEVRGVNLYARQVVDGRDRRQLERLCRYITRPAVAQDRLSERADGSLLLEFKKAWKDGTRALVLQPDDLLVRLCAAVPPPRFHQLRYFGVLSSHSALRDRVVPQRAKSAEDTSQKPPAAAGDQLELPLGSDKSAEPSRRKRWSWMLAHVFLADLDTCCRCGGPMRWVRAARTEAEAARLMAELGLAPQPPPVPHKPPLGQLALPF